MLPQAEFDKIADRLKELSREGGSIEAAQVKLIGLDEIREAAGPRWPRMRERVRTGSLGILSQHLGPEDVVVPAGDGFLVILAEDHPGKSQQRCQAMREALLSFYLGEEGLKGLRPEVRNHTLSAEGLTDLITTSVHKNTEPRRPMIAKGHANEIVRARVYWSHENRVGAQICAPVVAESAGRRIAYNPDFILDGKHTKGDFLELDIAILDEALTTAHEAAKAAQSYIVGLTVHATTMQLRRARESYLQWLSEIDPDLRRHLFVVISEIEKGTPLISISEWTSALRSLTARVWLDFHYTDHAIASVGGAGAWAAGFQLPIYTGAQKAPRAQRMLDQIAFWSRSIHGQGMKLCVHGFQEPEFLAAATKLGVDIATGDELWPFSQTQHQTAEAQPANGYVN